MDPLRWLLIVFQILTIVFGKHISTKQEESRKAYPRQMIIPNKFIPMLKESALFKSRSSSNDLSEFLKPKSHDDVTGKTRQNLMNAMGMDAGQEEGGMGAGGISPEGMGQGGMSPGGEMPGMAAMGGGMPGMAAMGGGMPGMAAMGGSEGMGSEGGMREGGSLEGLAKMAGGMGGPEGMNDQMNAMMKGMGGMPNSEGGGNSLEGLMGGNNAMNPMNNAGPEGMMSDSNQLPAGDPMGTLKSMLDNQGTNAALGTNTEAFGPGGSANANVLAMLNQIVGKEMPGESPIDPSSKSQQMWDQLEKGLSSQRTAVQPYIDSSDSKTLSAPPQQDAPSNSAPTNNRTSPSPTSTHSEPNNQTAATPVYNLTGLSKASSSSSQKILNQPKDNSVVNNASVHTSPVHTPPVHTLETKVTSSTSKTAQANIKSQAATHQKSMTKTTSNPAEIDLDDDEPLSDDMVKFLKGIKFVVSQEPGNDIILGKKFTSDVPPVSTSFKEENGVMKNVVFEKNKEDKAENEISVNKENNNNKAAAVVNVLEGIDLPYARNLLLKHNVKNEDLPEYQRAAKVLERASKKLKDPVAKKSTEIAIASILKVLELRNNKKTTPFPIKDSLTSGDVKSALSEKYFEAARVLGTASKKLADPVAKKSVEIGIASILKVSVLGNFSLSKKNIVPLSQYYNDAAEMYTSGINMKKDLIAADEIAHKLITVSNFERKVHN